MPRPKITPEEIIDRVELAGRVYMNDYTNIVDLTTPAIFVCPEHGEYKSEPRNVISNTSKVYSGGCKQCRRQASIVYGSTSHSTSQRRAAIERAYKSGDRSHFQQLQNRGIKPWNDPKVQEIFSKIK